MSWTLSRVRASGEAYLREMARARLARLSGAPAPSPREIGKAYSQELGQGALDLALEHAEVTSVNDDDARAGRALLAWLVQLELERECAPIDESLAEWRRTAAVRTADAQVVGLAEVDRAIAREPDRRIRLELDASRVALLERDVARRLVDRRLRMHDAVDRLQIAGSAREAAERLSGDSLTELADHARDALQQSADVWHDALGDRLRKHLSLTRAEARAADLSAALDASVFDAAFRPSEREPLIRRTLAGLALPPELGGRLRVEKLARVEGAESEVVALEVPGDVRLVLGEHAGVPGYRNALRAFGIAMRLGNVAGDAVFEHRWLGDPAVSLTCAASFASLLHDEGWLMRYAELSRNEARRLMAVTALRDLYELRLACAIHLHYLETIDADIPAGAVRDLYVEIVGNALGVRPNGIDADLDPPAMVTPGARLRGLEGASILVCELVERFDVDWYRNPRTGPWLVQNILAPAQGETVAELLKGATGHALSFGPGIRRIERALAA